MSPRLAKAIINGLLVGLAVLSLAPLLWMLSVSFMQPGEASHFPPPLLPADPTLHNYRELFSRLGMGRYLLNSFLIASLTTLVALLLNTMAGYAFAKLRFAGRDRVFRILLAALVIPAQVAMMPLFLMLKQMGLVNSYAGAIVPGMAGVFGIFLVRQYARSIPDELLEAARIDGAGEVRIFFQIVLPVLQADPGDAGDLRLPGVVERLHVAADRADRQRAAHAAGGAGEAVARTRAGQRDDDGRRGGDRAAGADAVPGAAALLPAGPVDGKRERIGMMRFAAWSGACPGPGRDGPSGVRARQGA